MSFIHVQNITCVLTFCHKGNFCLPPQLAESISDFVFIQSSPFTLQINLSSFALYRPHVIPQRGVERGRFFNRARSSRQFLRDYLPLYLNANAGPAQRMLFIRTRRAFPWIQSRCDVTSCRQLKAPVLVGYSARVHTRWPPASSLSCHR